MAELTREVVMDASPKTIFPFLTDPAQHVLWMGTEAELDPRVGGTYRVLVQGKHPGGGRIRGGRSRPQGGVHLRMG